MKKEDWKGVIPAITTPFNPDLSVDFATLKKHVAWLIESGCRGVVALGSLGESSTLSREEKIEVLKACKAGLEGRAPLVAGVAAISTADAVNFATAAFGAGRNRGPYGRRHRSHAVVLHSIQ